MDASGRALRMDDDDPNSNDDQAIRDETIGPFLIPDVLRRETDVVHVAPPRQAKSQLASMIRDLLSGSLASGQAALDWLKERSEYERDRGAQYAALSRLMRTLFRASLLRAAGADSETERLRTDAQERFAERIVRDWEGFCGKVTELFAFDLYVMDDAMRFVDQVMLPGKMSEFGEGS